jgi:type I restriction enzyme S subunit
MLQLSETQLHQVQAIIKNKLDESTEVFAYGSRTKQQAREYSDLDLLIKATEKLPIQTLYQLKDAFEFSELPFRVDVQDWFTLSKEFKQQIQSSLIKIS